MIYPLFLNALSYFYPFCLFRTDAQIFCFGAFFGNARRVSRVISRVYGDYRDFRLSFVPDILFSLESDWLVIGKVFVNFWVN